MPIMLRKGKHDEVVYGPAVKGLRGKLVEVKSSVLTSALSHEEEGGGV
jgi:hypothetical protein